MNHDHEQDGRWNPISKYVFWGFVLVAGYFAITEHRAHVVQYLPFLLLAACPLMHFFHGHGGHGGHGGGKTEERNRNPSPSDSTPTGKGTLTEHHDHP